MFALRRSASGSDLPPAYNDANGVQQSVIVIPVPKTLNNEEVASINTRIAAAEQAGYACVLTPTSLGPDAEYYVRGALMPSQGQHPHYLRLLVASTYQNQLVGQVSVARSELFASALHGVLKSLNEQILGPYQLSIEFKSSLRSTYDASRYMYEVLTQCVATPSLAAAKEGATVCAYGAYVIGDRSYADVLESMNRSGFVPVEPDKYPSDVSRFANIGILACVKSSVVPRAVAAPAAVAQTDSV